MMLYVPLVSLAKDRQIRTSAARPIMEHLIPSCFSFYTENNQYENYYYLKTD